MTESRIIFHDFNWGLAKKFNYVVTEAGILKRKSHSNA